MDSRNLSRRPIIHQENALKHALQAKGQKVSVLKRSVFGNLVNRNTQLNKDGTQTGKDLKSDKSSSGVSNILSETEIDQKLQPSAQPPLNKNAIDELSKAFSSKLFGVEDIDAADSDNPQLVSNYVNDIYKYLRQLEDDNRVKAHFLLGQKITSKMRGVLVDWLVQVHLKFALLQETLFLTIGIMDRFLALDTSIPKEKLQLVGVSCMLIASKYEEIYIPEIEDFSYISAKAFSVRDIRHMEIYILKVLKFNLAFPLHLHFLRRNSKASHVDGKQHTLAKYLLELTLAEYSFCWYKPSHVAAAASYLSLKLTDDEEGWTNTVHHYSSYSEEDLLPLVCRLACLVVKSPSTTKTVRDKYRQQKFMRISDSSEASSSNTVLRALAHKAASSKSPKS